MIKNEKELETKLKSGLVLWAEEHEVKPADFAEKMNYVYAYAWGVLRGKREFTKESFGRFSVAYGMTAAIELLKLADLPEPVESVGRLDGPEDANPPLEVKLKPRRKTSAAEKAAKRTAKSPALVN